MSYEGLLVQQNPRIWLEERMLHSLHNNNSFNSIQNVGLAIFPVWCQFTISKVVLAKSQLCILRGLFERENTSLEQLLEKEKGNFFISHMLSNPH